MALALAIHNVHLDLGGLRRGTDMGPSAIHVAGLVDGLRGLGHRVAEIVAHDTSSFEATAVGDTRARFLPEIHTICADLAAAVASDRAAGRLPICLGGDHSLAIGSIAGVARSVDGPVGVVWVDAHTDMNTPGSSPSGNIHGMPLATLLGYGHPDLLALLGPEPVLRPEHIAVIGARDVDVGEAGLVRELGVRVYTMSELDRRGTALCVEEAFERVTDGTAGVHLSFDLDGVDPAVAPGVGTPVPGGLNLRESLLLCEAAARTGRLLGLDNPTLDERNRTGELAVWLILTALGKRIL